MGRLHMKDAFFKTNHPVWFIGWVLPYLCERTVKNPSVWKESFTWIVPWIRSVRGVNLEGWLNGCRHWGVGNDGRIGNLLKKTQRKGSTISQIKWKIRISSRRWTNKIDWRRSGTENIHLDTATPNSRKRSKRFSWIIRRVSTFTASRLISGCRSDRWLLVHFNKLQKNRHHVEPRVKLYSPREKSFPGPLKYIDVSRTTHTNLDVIQENRIDDFWNGSRDLSDSWTGFTQFKWETSRRIFCGPGVRLTKRQLTSRPDHFMARTLERNGKER